MKEFIKKHKILVICVPIVILIVVMAILGVTAYNRNQEIKSLLREGNRYMSKSDYEQAIAVYRQTLQIDKRNVEARMGIAECYRAVGKTDYAVEEYSAIIYDKPKYPDSYVKLAEIHISEGELDKAKDVIESGKDNAKQSDAIDELWEISHPAAPTADLKPGKYSERQVVNLSAEGTNRIFYTLDGSDSENGSEYKSKLILKNGRTDIKAVACNNSGFYSDTAEFGYEIDISDEAVKIDDDAILDVIKRDVIIPSRDNPRGDTVNNDDLAQITSLYIIGNSYYAVNKTPDVRIESDRCYIGGNYISTNRNGNVKSLSDIAEMPYLETLVVAFQKDLDLSDFKAPASLKRLSLIGNNLTDDSLKAIADAASLEELCLGWNDIKDISALSKLTSLKSLAFWGNKVADISPLKSLKSLEYLDFSSNNVSDISAVSDLESLKELWIYDNTIKSIKPVSELRSLEVLMLAGNPVTDPETVRDIYPRLRKIDVDLLGLGEKEDNGK